MTDVRRRLQALWVRRGELDARLRLWLWRFALATRGVRQGLQTSWLRARGLRAIWAMPSVRPLLARGSASRRARIAAVSAAVIIAAAMAALVTGIPVPFLANALTKRFESETGYRLLIAGHAKIRLLPSPVVTASDISVADGKGGGGRTRFTADDIRIKMSLWSLISRRPRLTEVAIGSPTFQIPLLRERTTPALNSPATIKSGGTALPQNLTVDRLIVEDGAVEFVSRPDRVESRIDRIALTGALSADHVLAVKASGYLGDQVLRAELNGTLPAGRDDGKGAGLEFKVEAPGLLQDAAVGKADVRANGSLLTVNALAGTIGPAKFTGMVSVDFADKPMVKLDLDFQRLDLAVAGGAGSATGGAPAGFDQPWSGKSIKLDGLNYFDAEAQVSAAELRIDRFRFAPISVGAILAKGVLTAGVTRTGVYGGQTQGTLVIDASAAEPRHALRVDLTGVRALPLLSDLAGVDAIDGRMQAKIDTRGRGTNLRAIMSTLSGAVDLLVQDGELRSVNVAKLIRSLAASTLSGWQENKAEKTDLSQLSAFFRIDGGQAATDNLRLLGPLVRVTGTGSADLGAKTMSFKVEPKLVLSLEGQGGSLAPIGIGVPVAVQGPWGAPRIYPDMAGILDNPDAAYAKLRELGAGLFGTGTGQGLPGSPDNPLPSSIEALIDRLGGDRKEVTVPASGEKTPLPPTPPPRPAPQAQQRPPAPAPSSPPPAQSSSSSSSSSQSTSPGGPIEFIQKLFGGR
jgi:AsmA protein